MTDNNTSNYEFLLSLQIKSILELDLLNIYIGLLLRCLKLLYTGKLDQLYLTHVCIFKC